MRTGCSHGQMSLRGTNAATPCCATAPAVVTQTHSGITSCLALCGPVHLRIIGPLPPIEAADVKEGNTQGSHGIQACTYNCTCGETFAVATHHNQGVAQTHTHTQVRVEIAKKRLPDN